MLRFVLESCAKMAVILFWSILPITNHLLLAFWSFCYLLCFLLYVLRLLYLVDFWRFIFEDTVQLGLILILHYTAFACLEHFLSICARYYGDVLRSLYPLFGDSEPDDAVRDNAAGAVARMIMVHPESIPLNQVYNLVRSDVFLFLVAFISFLVLYLFLFLLLGDSCFLESSTFERRSRGIRGCLQLCV